MKYLFEQGASVLVILGVAVAIVAFWTVIIMAASKWVGPRQ